MERTGTFQLKATIPSFRMQKGADFGQWVWQWAPLGCLIRVWSLVRVVSWGIGHQNGGGEGASISGDEIWRFRHVQNRRK